MMMMTAYTSADHLTPLQEQSTVSTVGCIIAMVVSAGNHVLKENQATMILCAFSAIKCGTKETNVQ